MLQVGAFGAGLYTPLLGTLLPCLTIIRPVLLAHHCRNAVIVQDKIDGMAAKHPGRFKVYYIVDKPK